MLSGANAGAGGVLLPGISTYYNVDKSTLGYIFLATTIGFLIAAFASGPLTEKLGQRWFLLLGAAAFLSGAFLIALKPPFAVAVVLRLLMGVGVGGLEAGFNVYIAALPRSTSILNNLHAFYGVGALVGPIVASIILAVHWDWNNVYLIWAILSIPLVAGCGLLFRSKQPLAAQLEDESRSKNNTMLAVLRLRVVWLATLFLFIYVGIEVSLGNWGYSFLTEERNQGPLIAGWMVSGYWLGLTFGRFILASLFERLGLGIIHLIQACMVIIVVGALLVWLLPLGWVAAFGLFLIGFGLGPIYPTIVAMMPQLVPARLVSTAIGFLVSVSIIGIALFPWLAGVIAQSAGLWSLFPYNIALTALMLCFWLPLRVFPKLSSESPSHSSESNLKSRS